ncbi:hypothetical protein [Halalkalibacter krulwichiae]|nr:hypothetical protein [Halalkalibacter krulwichiae]
MKVGSYMVKQWLVVGMALVGFVGVWSLVFFSLNLTNSKISEVREPVVSSKALKGELSILDVMELNEAKTEDVEIGIDSEQNVFIPNQAMLDLSEYDFSDDETTEGVPIGDILKKLQLE